MKNTFIPILAAALFLTGCSINGIDNQISNDIVRQELSFKASLAEKDTNTAVSTKSSAVLDTDGKITKVQWSPTDAINVYFVGAEGSDGKFTNTSESSSDQASFKGYIDVFTGTTDNPVEDQMFWAIYPYSESNTFSDNAISFNLPTNQRSGENTFSDGQWPTMARSSGLNLAFYSICSGLKFNVSRDDITSVTFTNKDGGSISGTITAGWDSEGYPVVNSIAGGSDKVVVRPPEGKTTFTKGEWYFAVFAPATMSQGLEVYYQATNAHASFASSSSLTFKRNQFSTLNGKDTSYEDDPVTLAGYQLVTSEPSDWSGNYILVSADKTLIFTGDNGTSNSYTIKDSDKTGDIITSQFSSYEFNISKESSSYYLYNTGKKQYLYCNYSSGNGTTGMCYSSSKQALSLNIQEDGTFGFWMQYGSTDQYLYYKSSTGYFKFGGSHENHCVYLYKWNEGTTPTPTGDLYVKVTSTPSSWEGTYLFVDEDNSKAFAAFSDVTNHEVDVTITSDGIAAGSDIDKYALTVTATGENHVNISRPSYTVTNSSGKYVFYSSSTIQIVDSQSKYYSTGGVDVIYNHCFDYKDGGVEVLSSGNYSGFNKYYLIYDSQFTYSQTQSNAIQLYKLNGAPGKQSQTVSFGESSVKWTLGSTYSVGESYSPQTLTGAKTTVSYTSSNSAVATVESGKIKIIGAGATTITGTAAESDSYYAGTASYSLVISIEGAYNLENSSLTSFLDDAAGSYTDDKWSSLSVVSNYCSNSGTNRKDIPAPVSLSISGSGSRTVSVYSDQERTQKVMDVTTTSSTADIYNLIPNRTYYYSVSDGTSGSFTTEGRRRMMKVSDNYNYNNANNCRDLGGMTTTDGKTLKYELIYRGSNMDYTTDDEKTVLTETLGIKTDIDLRTSGTSPWSSESWGVSYKRTEYNSWDDLTNNSKINDTFTNIINSVTSGNACYIHCAVGADRTGYICLLLEAVLGVSSKDCSIDYELTSMSVVGTRTRNGVNNYYFTQGMQYIENQSGTSFKEKAEKTLIDAGITSEQITSLRNAMLQ